MEGAKFARQIRVSIDDKNKFLAWTFDEKWNEWSEPYFEKDEADKVAETHQCKYDRTTDSYSFEQGNEMEEFEALEIQTTDGVKKVYAIGAGSWVWDEVEWIEN